MLRKVFLNIALVWCMVSLGQAREETTVEECERNIPESLKNRICELRQYKTVEGKYMDRHMQCVLEVIGFVEDNGELVFQDLLGVLNMVDSALDHVPNLKKCKVKADECVTDSKANTFYTCFLGTSSAQAFKMAVDYGELIAAGKLSLDKPFNAETVSKEMKQIDDELCATAKR
ncbi:37 kDa salivary gland allergen Aed a 2-like [Anopheles maculipalpis]|uniref:37 kDa salivary gland allergen Aed a 2-like n=1 Tax=Anopheles maculipalpis TaxID=1496333 RepID=UPI0021595C63|nr:37 kDa salivary gland allergen Aed a 2-like [Anopheles maculipalpis]